MENINFITPVEITTPKAESLKQQNQGLTSGKITNLLSVDW